MEEQTKNKRDRSDPKVQRSVIVLTLALALVVFYSIHLFHNAPSRDDLAARSFRPPRRRSRELLQQGWNVYRELQDRKEAERLFKKALAISPKSPDAIDACGQMALLGGDYKRAKELFTEFHKLSNQSARSYANLAITALCMRDYEEGETLATTGLARYGKDNDFQFSLILACIYQKMGKGEQAAEYLARAAADGRTKRVLLMAEKATWAAPLREIETFNALQEAPPQDGKPIEQ